MNDRHADSGATTLYTIGKAAQASGLTTKAIRYYEQIDLIPKAPDSGYSIPDSCGARRR